jgi:hypothetical protein
MVNAMTRPQEVLAHLGGALLAAQIVERYVVLMLEPSSASDDTIVGLNAFVRRSKSNRLLILKRMLRDLDPGGKLLQRLDADLRRFLKDRNILVHRFQDLGAWNFKKVKDCDKCVTFLRDFIDRAAVVQHHFVTALSLRDVKYKTRVSVAQLKRYEKDYRRVYKPLEIRWSDLMPADTL